MAARSPDKLFDKVLIANRGEIALRIQRACRELGIKTVAVHSTADADAMHVRMADEAICIGPPSATDSYLNVPNIISAAEISQSDAIHPGYGVLRENANFARRCAEESITFVGPRPEMLALFGDKMQARALAEQCGVPLLRGTLQATSVDEASEFFASLGQGGAMMIKAVAGGGGGCWGRWGRGWGS